MQKTDKPFLKVIKKELACVLAVSAGICLAYNCVTTVAISCAQQYYAEENRKAWCVSE